jgi:hypothetical protein
LWLFIKEPARVQPAPADVVKAPAPVPPLAPGELALATERDRTLVFQRAFWRMPDADDHIIQAERREWAGADKDVRAWQWFIAVEPGPRLRDWLDTNPFQLRSVTALETPSGAQPAPAWFPRDLAGAVIQQAPGAGFALIHFPGKNQYWATDGGDGFARPAR